MTTWSYEQELAFRETQKAYQAAQAKYDPLEKARTAAVIQLGEMMGEIPSRGGNYAIGCWTINNAEKIIAGLSAFVPSTARMARLEADLKLAAETLRYYESMHRAKLQGSLMSEEEEKRTRIKIDRNQSLAERFEATLGIKPEGAAQ